MCTSFSLPIKEKGLAFSLGNGVLVLRIPYSRCSLWLYIPTYCTGFDQVILDFLWHKHCVSWHSITPQELDCRGHSYIRRNCSLRAHLLLASMIHCYFFFFNNQWCYYYTKRKILLFLTIGFVMIICFPLPPSLYNYNVCQCLYHVRVVSLRN